MLSRRQFLLASTAALVAQRRLLAGVVHSAPSVVTVYKDPGCECCTKWVRHLSANGFVVMPRDVSNIEEIKRTMHVPKALESCHTAVVDRYVVEGHVPASVLKKFLAEKPSWLGLAVPGMPMGAPGMEGNRVDHYDVIAFDQNGKQTVFDKR